MSVKWSDCRGEIVSVEVTPAGRLRAAERVTLWDVDVEVAVVVHVEQRDAWCEDLSHVEAAGHPVDVLEVEARFSGTVCKPGRRFGRRGRRRSRLSAPRRDERCGRQDAQRRVSARAHGAVSYAKLEA
jgi:hypothetical protein